MTAVLQAECLHKDEKINKSSQWELRLSVFQCDMFIQICLLLARPSFWSRNDTKLPKPWKMSLILSNMHSTWAKCATIIWQTFIVLYKTFSLVQSIQFSGKLYRLKNKHVRKNVYASRLNANGSIECERLLIIHTYWQLCWNSHEKRQWLLTGDRLLTRDGSKRGSYVLFLPATLP